jgi:hypothetical protein
MSGKRAKPSPWRFLRATPVVVVAVVVWVLVGFFLLLPGAGTDRAHDWGAEPIPSSSDDEATSDGNSFSSGSPEPSTSGTEAPPHPTAAPEDDATSKAPAPDLELSAASRSGPTRQPAPQPAPRPTRDPTSPAPTQPASGQGADDNPGKKKGHHKPHGPPGGKP